MILFGTLIFFLNKNNSIQFLDFFMHHFERESTKHEGIGLLNFLIGVFLTMLIFGFNKNIVMASILILSIGDSVSPIIGIYFGKRKINFLSKEKLVEGTIAGIILSGIAASFFVPLIPAFVASTIAMVGELVELKNKVDDNILIPLISGLVLFLLNLI